MRHVIVAGSTGLIGSEVLRQLAGRQDLRVTALVRKESGRTWPEAVVERVFNFDQPGDYRLIGSAALPCDVLLCCVGTTMRQAGSKAMFQRVDRDVPLALVASVVALGPKAVFGFVSSVGAGKPRGFYLSNKAETEQGIIASGVRHVIVRPSLLLGHRQEFRLGERLATWVMPPLMGVAAALTLHKLSSIETLVPITAERVARTLIQFTVEQPPASSRVIEGRGFLR